MIKSKKQKNTITKRVYHSLFVSFLAFALCGLFSSKAYAETNSVTGEQQKQQTVQGVVTDTHGNTLIGVNILLKGKSRGTITDIDGKYSLAVDSESDELVFSYIGYKTTTVKANKSKIDIVMQDDISIIDEVVVVGYGTQKKENLTGAVFSVDIDKVLDGRPVADVGRMLQGTVPGVNIVVPSGEIGSDPIIKIRGQVGSVSGDNKPLILLDNVEIPSLQMVNPDDIESISILKDAAASSIYGSKAAFGVVLVTSKKGAKTEGFEVSYSNNFSWQDPAKKIKMGGIEGLQHTLDAHRNMNAAGAAGGFWRISDESIQASREWMSKYGKTVGKNDPMTYMRDWYVEAGVKYGVRPYDAIEQTINSWVPAMNHNLSVNGRSGKMMYHVGLGYMKQEGLNKPAKHDDFRRYNASVSLTSEINKYLTVRASSMYSDTNKRYPGVGGTDSDPWLYLYRWSVLFPVGVQSANGDNLNEPAYEMANVNTDNIQNKYYNINIGATLNFTKDWDMQFDYTYDRRTVENNSSYPQNLYAASTWYTPQDWFDEDGYRVFVDEEGNITNNGGYEAYRFTSSSYVPEQVAKGGPFVERKTTAYNTNTFNLFSTYKLKLGTDQEHDFKFMAGMNAVKHDWNSHTSNKKNPLALSGLPQLSLASGAESIKSDANWDSQLGYFGRINYMYDSKYLFEANLRYDGTSKFPKHLKWQWFPSFSAGWILSSEKFMEALNPVWSFAKIRASWGSIGDQSVSNTYYRGYMDPTLDLKWLSGGVREFAVDSPQLYQDNIGWQKIETLDIGFDFRFWKDKIGVTFDWYQRDTKDMIVSGEKLPATLGASVARGNYGNLRTKGWEITVDFNHRFSNGLGINAMATLSDAITDITKAADQNVAWENRAIHDQWVTGKRYGDIYGFVTDRLYQKDDFVHDAQGNLVKTKVIYRNSERTTNLQTGQYPIYQVEFENNGNMMFAPGDVKYVDVDGDGYISEGSNTFGDMGDQVVIGNSTPRYEYGFRLGADYKGFDASIFFQGIGKRKIWGHGQLAIPGFHVKDGATPYTFATEYWTEDRTDAFYPRAWNYNAGASKSPLNTFSMKRQSKYLLDMSYLRIKNITFGYTFPPKLLKKALISKARVYMSLENFFTFDNLRGLPIDPEVITGYSMFRDDNEYNMGRTGVGTPTFKSVSFGLQLTF